MTIPITNEEVEIYIRDYRLKHNGEYPTPTRKSEVRRKTYLKNMNTQIAIVARLNKLSEFYDDNPSSPILCEIEVFNTHLFRIRNKRIVSETDYKSSLAEHLRKGKVFKWHLKGRLSNVKEELKTMECIIRARYKKISETIEIKRELLENSAKICLNPKRIMRLLDENVISLDNIETLYHL
jgi:hypothetical protein